MIARLAPSQASSVRGSHSAAPRAGAVAFAAHTDTFSIATDTCGSRERTEEIFYFGSQEGRCSQNWEQLDDQSVKWSLRRRTTLILVAIVASWVPIVACWSL